MDARFLGMNLLWLLGASVAVSAGDSWAPADQAFQRYEDLWRTSPFIVAAVQAAPSDTRPERYTMTGYAKVGGNDVVFLLDKESLARFSVASNQPEEGVKLVSVTENSSGIITAKIRVGNRDANVALDVGTQQAEMVTSMTNILPGPISEYAGTRDK